MPNLFSITTTTNTVRLDEKRQGEVTFTVSNASERPMRGRALPQPEDPKAADWLRLEGEAERDFPEAGTERYTVTITVPEGAPPGSYALRLDMVNVQRPDEDYTRGQTITVEVPKAEPNKKPFPVWPVLVGLGVLLLVFLLWPREGTTHERMMLTPDPSLSGHSWNSPDDTQQFLDLDRYNYRAGVSREEDLPQAGESISLLTFPSHELSGSDIALASLELGTANVVGDPFTRHGNLLIEEVSYASLGPTLADAPDLTSPRELFRLTRPHVQPEEGAATLVLEVTGALKASLDESQRLQIRLLFEDVELEDMDDMDSDYVEWNHADVHLRITVLVPYRRNLLW